MGREGIGAAIYFKVYGRMFTNELRFEVRSRRPPKDPVNALLSLGYMLLTNEVVALVSAHGMDAYLGFLHGIDYGRPALALDLVEEFRHPFIDRFTLNLINNEILKRDDFQTKTDGGVYLNEVAFKQYLKLYGARIREPMILEASDQKLSFRDLIQRQVQTMMHTIKFKLPYKPFRMRW
jgi:CRISPR-associated protein Cas1